MMCDERTQEQGAATNIQVMHSIWNKSNYVYQILPNTVLTMMVRWEGQPDHLKMPLSLHWALYRVNLVYCLPTAAGNL
jgi:hypothetical protein